MIPKIIYIFWHDKNLPKVVKVCLNSIKLHCPDYKIVILNEDNYKQKIKRCVPKTLSMYSIQKKANWIRTAIIAENGGIWMDASILLTESINNWINLKSNFIGINNGIRIENCVFCFSKTK